MHRALLEAALAEVTAVGFRELRMDAIAARAGAGKTTLYRRWPNKAAVVMDALLTIVGPGTAFPEARRAVDRMRLQMRLQAKFFRSSKGRLIRALLGEAQFDAELAAAFRDRWIRPRRRMTRAVLEAAIEQGDLRADIDVEAAIELLYGPLYYRLLIGTGPISDRFADGVLEAVLRALGQSSRSGGAR